MPFKDYRQTSAYGFRTDTKTGKKGTFHAGIDLVKSYKALINAFTAGTVVYAGFGNKGSGLGGYGNVVLVKDKNGRGQLYAHLDSVSVKNGQSIKNGQVIGRQGATGQVTGSHLHYEVRKTISPSHGWTNNKSASTINPTSYIKSFYSVLTVDGKWGNATTKALQRYFGTVVDGFLSDQTRNPITNALYGTTVKFGNGKKGSLVIKALQSKLGGLKKDGLLGPLTIGKLQNHLNMKVVDSKLSRPSAVVKESQKRLNAGGL